MPSSPLSGAEDAAGAVAAKQPDAQPPAEQQEEESEVTLQASSHLLKSASEKFQAAMERWAEPGAAKQLVFQCRDGEEVGSYRHLLAFVHSHGRELPQGADTLLGLLLLAREHAVEPAIAACLQQLLIQVQLLPPSVCLSLITELETGCSAHSSVQAAADQLVSLCCNRLGALLAEAPALLPAHIQLHAAVLSYLGPLHCMLRDDARRQLFAKLPFWMLRDSILGGPAVAADTEATVLAAAAYWAEFNMPCDVYDALGRVDDVRRQAAELCSRIRLPLVPAHILLNYHSFYRLLQWFDRDKTLVMRAIASSRDLPMHLAMQQAAVEIEQMGADSENEEEEEEEEEGPDVDEGGEGKAAALRTLR
ncbi:hypothetical protein COHA_003090 [Chlorella ohadii]|uniref:BTB domain-containing protein n=1 Tax=Chlorella ohadii TaxID=2649997 RepID=A0AAD5DVY4_9CHLO|nr:hypothetical protein COHA_003090 [Chlorella ohadii]